MLIGNHATGIVIGETAVVENDVSILQDVTLGGGTGKEGGLIVTLKSTRRRNDWCRR